MVEASMQCAQGTLSIDALEEKLENQGEAMKRLAPSEGLYLAKVTY
jgi:tRNA U38,U39,U40 pseudouridine synthase TruA